MPVCPTGLTAKDPVREAKTAHFFRFPMYRLTFTMKFAQRPSPPFPPARLNPHRQQTAKHVKSDTSLCKTESQIPDVHAHIMVWIRYQLSAHRRMFCPYRTSEICFVRKRVFLCVSECENYCVQVRKHEGTISCGSVSLCAWVSMRVLCVHVCMRALVYTRTRFYYY